MLSRRVTLIAIIAALSGVSELTLGAHAGPRLSDPLEGATLGDTPVLVRLYFSEQPEPSLSTIRVLDTRGAAYQTGRPTSVPGDPLSLAVGVRTLPKGVYVVNWRVVSAVDGHVTAGTYAFGVRMTPAAAGTQTASTASSFFEILARFILIAGLVVLLGFAAARVARVADTTGLAVGAWGWFLATLGLALLATAQRNSASASWAALVKTSVGHALIWRAVALGAAGLALLCVRLAPVRFRATATSVVALAALTSMAVHVSNGHAAAGGRWPPLAAVAVQWMHFAAVGLWVGGLGMLWLRIRGTPSAATSTAVRRFSVLAGVGLFLVAATGAVLTAGVVSSWSKSWTELTSTGYGRT
ncbi:MAG: copper resistance protein CopC, partial [Thermoanaerobaculia bacterium]